MKKVYVVHEREFIVGVFESLEEAQAAYAEGNSVKDPTGDFYEDYPFAEISERELGRSFS
jgi:hypothetical protein